jgi:nicotinate phosphoribosyltransferase
MPHTASRPVIQSLLDTDLYKFTMAQPTLHFNPGTYGTMEFQCRNTPEYPLAELAADVERELDHLCTLTYSDDDLARLSTLPYLKPDYIEFLGVMRLRRKFITVSTLGEELHVRAEGPLLHISHFEIFALSIVNELYFRRFETPEVLEEGRRRLAAKIAQLKAHFANTANHRRHAYQLFDFGTRRRFSRAWQEEVIRTLATEVPQWFKGTSNVRLAFDLNLAPIGTMAHEHLQKFQGLPVQLKLSQRSALEEWVQEYRGSLGVALTDVITTGAFLRDFDLFYAKLFDGLRHDSGDPDAWASQVLAHYAKLKVDAHTKRLVFSNGLDFTESLRLYGAWGDQAGHGSGIGTWLTNDLGVKPLNIVMKLRRVNGQPVAKISDDPTKTSSTDPVFEAYLRQVYGLGN